MNRKSLSILAFAIALALALSACAPTEAPSPSVQPTAEPTPTAAPTDEVVAEPTSAPEVTILKDMVGRQVELPAQVETVPPPHLEEEPPHPPALRNTDYFY